MCRFISEFDLSLLVYIACTAVLIITLVILWFVLSGTLKKCNVKPKKHSSNYVHHHAVECQNETINEHVYDVKKSGKCKN